MVEALSGEAGAEGRVRGEAVARQRQAVRVEGRGQQQEMPKEEAEGLSLLIY